jgi:hypothetical protein
MKKKIIKHDRKTKIIITVLRFMIGCYDCQKNKDVSKNCGRLEFNEMLKRQPHNKAMIESAMLETYQIFDDYVKLSKKYEEIQK